MAREGRLLAHADPDWMPAPAVCSNPMAGMDSTLLALAGTGHAGGRTFGFASCDRVVGAAEGMNVLLQQRVPLLEDAAASAASSSSSSSGTNGHANGTNGHANGSSNGHANGSSSNGHVNGSSSSSGSAGSTAAVPERYRYEYRVTNVEYTEFERLGVEDAPREGQPAFSKFPANTNVLYVGLQVRAVQRVAAAAGGMAWTFSRSITRPATTLCATPKLRTPHSLMRDTTTARRRWRRRCGRAWRPAPRLPSSPACCSTWARICATRMPPPAARSAG